MWYSLFHDVSCMELFMYITIYDYYHYCYHYLLPVLTISIRIVICF